MRDSQGHESFPLRTREIERRRTTVSHPRNRCGCRLSLGIPGWKWRFRRRTKRRETRARAYVERDLRMKPNGGLRSLERGRQTAEARAAGLWPGTSGSAAWGLAAMPAPISHACVLPLIRPPSIPFSPLRARPKGAASHATRPAGQRSAYRPDYPRYPRYPQAEDPIFRFARLGFHDSFGVWKREIGGKPTTPQSTASHCESAGFSSENG